MPLPGGVGRGVHLTKHQPDPQADDISCWPAVVPLLTTRCLYWGRVGGIRELTGGAGGIKGHWGVTYEKSRWSIAKYSWKVKVVYCRQYNMNSGQWDQDLYHSWPPDTSPLGGIEGACWGEGWGGTCNKTSVWSTGSWHVMLTCSSTTLDH